VALCVLSPKIQLIVLHLSASGERLAKAGRLKMPLSIPLDSSEASQLHKQSTDRDQARLHTHDVVWRPAASLLQLS